ncbi:MAG: nitrogen fixation protein NifQ [Bradyrhizobium sp.]|jgi:hypothetical protein|nr:nitrogen fixation protein NifQ [Bradyrhizobium sp.]
MCVGTKQMTRLKTPIYTQCNDFDRCYGEESGERRMVERRREFLLRAGSFPPQNLQGR